MKKIILIIAIGIIVISAPNSIKTAYNINEINQHLDFSLELLEFGNSSVLLEWSTDQETVLTGFQVERLDANGHYETAGFVPAFGSGEDHVYRFVDTPTTSGKLQYRILKLGTENKEYIHQSGSFLFNPDFSFMGVSISADDETITVNFELDHSTELGIRLLSSAYKEILAISDAFDTGRHAVKLGTENSQTPVANACFLEFVFNGKRILQEIIL
ncbi:MAG: hypothetical protein DWQ05_08010 [Calditrichaeota bacterium]|nr:MAG: hypothetical protein DWQ05_08010 [Calditrichota bacterium]